MILGYNSNLGTSVLLGGVEYVPQLTGFTSITFGGTSDMIITDVWGQEQIEVDGQWTDMTTDYLDNYVSSNINWTLYTYLLTMNQEGLEGGSIQGIGDITGWALYRYDNKTEEALLLANFDADVPQYMDYTALLNRDYYYLLYAYGTEGTSSALQTPSVSLNYYGYFLIDVTNDVVYKFDTNFSGGELTQNTDYSSFRTNNKYQTYHTGDLQYLSGQITALVRYANSDNYINNSIELLQNLRDCVKDDTRTKILKTRKGEGWYVFTKDYNDSVVNQAIGAQPVNASFSFDEIGTLDSGIDSSAFNVVY